LNSSTHPNLGFFSFFVGHDVIGSTMVIVVVDVFWRQHRFRAGIAAPCYGCLGLL
jgi:hypothetical protein